MNTPPRDSTHCNTLDALAARLSVSPHELTEAVGLDRDTLDSGDRITQQRLDDLVSILERVTHWSGDPKKAFVWYRTQALPSFGDLTPERLVQSGRTTDLVTYLERISDGGYS